MMTNKIKIDHYQKSVNELPRLYTRGLVFDKSDIEIGLDKLSENEYLELIIE